MSPKVSVIIPNYNHGRYLRQRIDTVLKQTYRNFEIIILDDHSTDDSIAILESYIGSPHVREIILNDRNSGSPFKQWKAGLQKATGEWIWIAESDDYADERFLETMIRAVDKRHNVGLAYCDSKIVNDTEVSQNTFAAKKNKDLNDSRWSKSHYNNGLNEIENYLLPYGTINNTSAVLFKRNILQVADPFDIDLRYIGDKYAFLKVLGMSDVAYVKDSLNYYRNPFTTKHQNKLLNFFYEHFLVFNWVYRNLKQLNRKKFFSGFYANTQSSLVKGWNGHKISIYRKLFYLNPYLLLRNICYNCLRPLTSLFYRVPAAVNSPSRQKNTVGVEILNFLHARGFITLLNVVIRLIYFLKGFGIVESTYRTDFRAYVYKVNQIVFLSRGPGWVYSYTFLRNILIQSFNYYYTPKEGDCIIDLGAGLGEETLIYALMVGKSGRVFSIEANPSVYAGLKFMCAENKFTWVIADQLAIYNNNGEVAIEDDAENYLVNSINNGIPDRSTIRVKAQTFDSFVKDKGITRVDFLKSNIEGAEQFLIEGMNDSVGIVKHLCISCHDFRQIYHGHGNFYLTREKVKSFLENKGFEITLRSTGNSVVDDYIYAVNPNI